MKTITIYFFNEDSLGNETGTHILTFLSNLSGDDLYLHINTVYSSLLQEFEFYSLIEDYNQ